MTNRTTTKKCLLNRGQDQIRSQIYPSKHDYLVIHEIITILISKLFTHLNFLYFLKNKSEIGFLAQQNKVKKKDITQNSKRKMLHMRLFYR